MLLSLKDSSNILNYFKFSFIRAITFSLKDFILFSAFSLSLPLTARYTFIFGSVPEGLTTNDEPSSSINLRTFDLGKSITFSSPNLKFSSLLSL